MLASQLIDIDFSAGINSKTDPNIVDPPSLLTLQNAIFQEGGTLVKRNGFKPLGNGILGGGTLTTGQALATFDNELLQITASGEVYSYSQSQNAWMDRGASSPVTIADTPIIRNSYAQSDPDMDSVFGVTVFAWVDTRGGVRATAIDEATGAALLTDVSLSTSGSHPRVVGVGTTLCVLFAASAGLTMVTLNALSPSSFSLPVVLDTNLSAGSPMLDAKTYDGLSLVAAWANQAGTTRVAIILPAGYEGLPVNGYPAPVNVAITPTAALDVLWDGVNNVFWISGASAAGLVTTTLTAAFLQALAPTTVDANASVVNITGAVSGPTLTLWYEESAALTYNHLTETNTISTGGAVGVPANLLRSVGLGSKVFGYNGGYYLLVNFSSPLQPTTFLVNAVTGNIVGKGQPFLSGGLFTDGMLPKVIMPVVNKWSVPSPTRQQIVNQATSSTGAVTTYTTYFLVGIDRLDFYFNATNSDSYSTAQMGENLHFTGGVLQMYDGSHVVEHGFHFFPEGFTCTPVLSGGFMADGTYSVTFCWYWADGKGQLFRSAPGQPVSVTITGGGGFGSISCTVPTLRLTSKTGAITPPILAAFRTPANLTALQRVGNGAADPVLAPVYSSTSTDTVSFTMTVADTTIAANEFLYTTGGTLSNIEPGGAALVATSHDRVFLAGMPGLPNTVFFSQEWVPGTPANFNPALSVNVSQSGGPITAIATMDTNVLFFKESQIYFMSGEGPDATGNNSLFTLPQLVTADVGCTLPESICLSPLGLMFKTNKGIYLLDRSLNCTYKGANAEGFNSLKTSAAVLVDGVNQIRFTTANGPALIYDYYFDQWGTFTNTYGSNPTFNAFDAVAWQQVPYQAFTMTTSAIPSIYTYLDSSGIVHVETPGVYLDNLTAVAMFIQTAWIKLSNLQGFVKIPWITALGRWFSNHVLQIGVAYDYNETVQENRLYNPGLGTEVYGTGIYGIESPYGGVPGSAYQFRFRPNTMKCQAIQFTFTEQQATNGAGFALSGLTLQAAMMRGPFKKLSAGSTLASS